MESLCTMLAVLAVVFACSSVSVTADPLLVPKSQNVSLGGTITMRCQMSFTNAQCSGTEHEGVLYKVEDGNPVLYPGSDNVTSAQLQGSKCFVTTRFDMTATRSSGGIYGCFKAQVGQHHVAPSDRRPNEVTVHVCELLPHGDPQLELHHSIVPAGTSNTIITVNATTWCDFKGAWTWRVNGAKVPLAADVSQGDQPALMQRDNDVLVINSTAACRGRTARLSRCNITAEYTYIQERRTKVSTQTTEILGCCIEEEEVVPTSKANSAGLQEELVPTTKGKTKAELAVEKAEQHMRIAEERWSLKKDVLLWKKKVLPLQFRLLQRLNASSPQETTVGELEAINGD